MEQEKNNKRVIALLVVIIVFLLALVILLATGTISFKSDELKNNQQTTENNQKQNESNQQIKENGDTSQEQITQNDDKYKTKLTNDGVIENVADFIQLSLKNNERKDVIVSGKKLSLELIDNVVYLNNKNLYSSDIDIENVPNNITITKEMILIVKPAGQFGNEYSFYDLNGNEIKYVGKPAQFNNLKNEDEKLKVDAFIFENQWMGGYKIGNIMTINDSAACSGKRLKDYPNIVEEHKNDVLDADYYFYLSGNEVTLKYDKVLLTVGDLDLNTCVMGKDNT